MRVETYEMASASNKLQENFYILLNGVKSKKWKAEAEPYLFIQKNSQIDRSSTALPFDS